MIKSQAIVIGASAGAMDALSALLPALPADYLLPVFIVVHLPQDKESILAELFMNKCPMRVLEAEDKIPIERGTVYFAPPNYHMLIESNKQISLSNEEPVLFSRPSINVLFETAADAYGEGLIGIILTGANEDGAAGFKAIHAAGGQTLVLRPELAYASAMPQAAIAACPSAQIMSMNEITAYLKKAVMPCP